MSRLDKAPARYPYIKILISVLVIFAGVQTWYLMGIKQQLSNMRKPPAMVSLPAPVQILPPMPLHDMSAAMAFPGWQTIPEQTLQPTVEFLNLEQRTVPPAMLQLIQAGRDTLPPTSQRYEQRPSPQRDYSYRTPNGWQPWDRPDWNRHEERHWQAWNEPSWKQREEREWRHWSRLSRDMHDEIEQMKREIDRMFEQSNDRHDSQSRDRSYSFHEAFKSPKVKLREDSTQYIITVNIPGADENDVSVSLDGQRLNIRSKRKSEKTNTDSSGNVVFSTRSSGNYQRSITLPERVIKNAMKTKVDNGVLTIIIPKDKEPA